MTAIRAYQLTEHDGRSIGRLENVELDQLGAGEVLMRTTYAGVNFKDALAGTGRAPIVKRFPCIGGIEAVGVVESSSADAYRPGDQVIVHGRGLGVDHDGGFAEYVRVPADWIVPIPPGLDMFETACLGVAGHTAAVAIDLMELNGLRPESGPVVVTGASGGVASLSIDMLAVAGYAVTAVSRRPENSDYLRKLGAQHVIPPPEQDARIKPLDTAEWAGAVDAAGGHVLAWVLSRMIPNGTVAAFGNAAGVRVNTTVMPFILRGVRLLGVNANTEPDLRRRLWNRLGSDLKPRHLTDISTPIGLTDLPDLLEQMADGQTRGRYVVCFE
ncbi:acryloyl-CoA reductase [Ectothiorhodospiraceae bacterium WFHF3C12]|nr:acryloyl-CoA reductase [Ectothiorhodospiraceae bacterium WFHF3C12]